MLNFSNFDLSYTGDTQKAFHSAGEGSKISSQLYVFECGHWYFTVKYVPSGFKYIFIRCSLKNISSIYKNTHLCVHEIVNIYYKMVLCEMGFVQV